MAAGRQSEWCPAWDSHTSLQGRGGDQTILQFFFLPISVKDSEFVIPAADFAGGSSQIQYWLKCRALYWCIQYDWHCMCLAVALGGGSKAFWKTRTFHADFQYSLLQVVKLEIPTFPWYHEGMDEGLQQCYIRVLVLNNIRPDVRCRLIITAV